MPCSTSSPQSANTLFELHFPTVHSINNIWISGAICSTLWTACDGSVTNHPSVLPAPPSLPFTVAERVRDKAALPRPLAVALGKHRQSVQTQGGSSSNEDVYRGGKKRHEQTGMWTHIDTSFLSPLLLWGLPQAIITPTGRNACLKKNK